MMTFALMILPGLIVGYFLFLRPVLHALPELKQFYAEADGFWATAWALCGKSVTMVWAFVLQGLSWALQWIDPIANMVGDPELRTQITDTLGANPKILGYVLMAISFVTIAARLRSFAKAE